MTHSNPAGVAERLHRLCFPDDLAAGDLVRRFVEAFWASQAGMLPRPIGRVDLRVHFRLDGDEELEAHDGCSVHVYLSEGALQLGHSAGLAMVSTGQLAPERLPARTRVLIMHDPAWERA